MWEVWLVKVYDVGEFLEQGDQVALISTIKVLVISYFRNKVEP